MSHERPRCMPLTIAVTAAILVLPQCSALARSWDYSLTAAASSRYDYRVDEHSYGTYTSSLGPGFAITGSAARSVSRHVSLVLSGGYRRYSAELGTAGIPEAPPTTGDLRAEYFSVGAGLKIEPRQGAGFYTQVLPALFVSRWGQNTVDQEGWNMLTGTWQQRATHTASFKSALPGIELSGGFRARFSSALGTDFALRYTRSADLGEHALGSSSGDFRGLNELALVGGITWSP